MKNLRTEEDVLKDFEKLGWKVTENNKNWLRIENMEHDILIYKTTKEYDCDWISLIEHKLLNELFTIWGWI